MEELAEIFTIETLEQLRALTDPLRMRILEQLVQQPMTMSQLGSLFGETTAKMHYHVRELERLGFIRLVEKRERGGFLEKYYRAVARDVQVPSDLLRTTPVSDLAKVAREYFDGLSREVLPTLENLAEESPNASSFASSDEMLWLTQEEFAEVERQIEVIFRPFRSPRQVPGEQAWLVHFIAHAPGLTEEEQDSAKTRLTRFPGPDQLGQQNDD